MVIILFAVTGAMPLAAEEPRGVRVRLVDAQGCGAGWYRESYALIIGVSDYTNGWPPLPGAKKDVTSLKKALERHGFVVTTVMNPRDRHELDAAFHAFIQSHGHHPDNRLLFYFAGHGHTEKLSYGGTMGYIVPADAPDPQKDKAGFLDRSLDMQQIEVYAKRIQAKHALFLFDSCFSGSIFSLSRAIPENINYKTALPVRQFITSGSPDETVPDESIFRRQFVAALEGEGDVDRDGYVTATELGEFLQKKVINYSKNTQHPQYGKIRDPNLDKGDFVFAIAPEGSDPIRKSLEFERETDAAPPQQSGNQRIRQETVSADGQEGTEHRPAGPLKIAVLPMRNDTGDPKMEWLGRGIAEKITTVLAQERNPFKLVERMQIDKVLEEQKFQESTFVDPDTAVEIGRILGVDYVLIGSYQRFGGRLRLDVKRVFVRTGEIRGAMDVIGEDTNVFELQDSLASKARDLFDDPDKK